MRLALPREHAEEIQPHGRVRVFEHPSDPAAGALDHDAEFLVQLACQCSFQRFARLHLAAGEFPVAGVDLALWALRQQHAAVGLGQHRGDDFGH